MTRIRSKYKPGSTVTIFCHIHLSFHRKSTIEYIKTEEDGMTASCIVTIKEVHRRIRLGWIIYEEAIAKSKKEKSNTPRHQTG